MINYPVTTICYTCILHFVPVGMIDTEACSVMNVDGTCSFKLKETQANAQAEVDKLSMHIQCTCTSLQITCKYTTQNQRNYIGELRNGSGQFILHKLNKPILELYCAPRKWDHFHNCLDNAQTAQTVVGDFHKE